MTKIGILLVCTFWLWAIPTSADQPGWAFLKIGSGAKGASLGETFIATTRDPSSGFYNPAGIAGFRGKEWTFSHVEWFRGVRIEAVSFTSGRGHRTVTTGVVIHAVDGIERRTQASMQPLGEFGVYDVRIDFTYAQQHGRLSIGGTAKIVSEKILEEAAVGGAVDIGAVYAVHPFLLGWSLRNLGGAGGMQNRSDDLPLDWNIGVTYGPSNVPVIVTGATRISADRAVDSGIGVEYRLAERFSLRGGYRAGVEAEGGSVGIGIVVKRWAIDYAFVPFDLGLGETHRATLSFR
ncbi:MAG: PorV/PorQ family protein [Candidatus Latescibacteria bacterium]|nr:PorV/PorQ family protein [Candidatus Latescibacterota bacterium]